MGGLTASACLFKSWLSKLCDLGQLSDFVYKMGTIIIIPSSDNCGEELVKV